MNIDNVSDLEPVFVFEICTYLLGHGVAFSTGDKL